MEKKRRARTPPFKNYPDWSEAKFWGFLRSGLRACYNRWPPKWEVLRESRRASKSKDKRLKWEYKCNDCKKWHKQKDVSVDHIIPAGALSKPEDIAGFVERLFVGVDGLQVLCKGCHNIKTQAERNGVVNDR